MSDILSTLAKVDLLAGLDEDTLVDLAARARRRRFGAGARIVNELEAGADVYIIMTGEAEISVEARAGARRTIGKIGPGGLVGEMSSLTGELRSATVSALGPVEVLVIDDADFDALRERRPEIAVALVRLLAGRLAAAERSLDDLFGPAVSADERAEIVARKSALRPVARGSLHRAWRELVVNRRRDLAFLALAAFVLTLVAVRAAVFVAFRYDWSPRGVLRAAYMTGFALLALSTCTALLTFRPGWRRAVAVAFGIGLALIFNELGVTLAFDIFFKDIDTPDPAVPFDLERLYRRTEGLRALLIGLVVLIQAAYLRRFYRRAGFVIMTRLRRLLTSSTSPRSRP